MVTNSKHRGASGFSLIELLVVAAIMMCIAALAIPTMWNVIANSQLRSAMGDVSGFMQNSRSDAVKQNRVKTVHFSNVSGRTVITSRNADADVDDRPERQFPLPRGMEMVGEGAPSALDANTMWGGGTDPETTDVSFNPRGMPCTYAASKCDTGTGFVYYFSLTGNLKGTRWAAIGVSPAGRIKAFYWNGSKWGN